MSEWERHIRVLEQTRKDVNQLKREVSIQRIKVQMYNVITYKLGVRMYIFYLIDPKPSI